MQTKQTPTEGNHSANQEPERKYASELQELCDLIMGGENVPAPFREIKERLLSLLNYPPNSRSGSMYRCSACRRLYRRESSKKWIKSICVKTGRDARLIRVPNA